MIAMYCLLTIIWIEYVCLKCGFFNPSARSKKRAAQRTPSPPSPAQQLPAITVPLNVEGNPTSGGAKHVEVDDVMQTDDE